MNDMAKNAVDELTYRSYAYNRKTFPEISPDRWKAIFPEAGEFEKRYQEKDQIVAALLSGQYEVC